MKYTTTLLLAGLSAFAFSAVGFSGLANATAGQDALADSQHIDGVYEASKVEAFIDIAFDKKAQAYSEYATLFNLCQKQPNNEKCGDEYKQASLTYNLANSVHEALVMTWTPEFRTLLIPTVAMPQLRKELGSLGYLSTGEVMPTDAEVLVGLNAWLTANQFEPTTDIYLLHAYLVSTDAMAANNDVVSTNINVKDSE